jgi:hypothetical protein
MLFPRHQLPRLKRGGSAAASRIVLVQTPFDVAAIPMECFLLETLRRTYTKYFKTLEPLTRIELVTSSLPRTRSTN